MRRIHSHTSSASALARARRPFNAHPARRLADRDGDFAELSDGTFWSDDVDVIVTLAACTAEVAH
jgi:hypothetical protein